MLSAQYYEENLKLKEEISAADEENRKLKEGISATGEENRKLKEGIRATSEENRKLKARINAAEEEKAVIESSTAVRVVRRYWNAVEWARAAKKRLSMEIRRRLLPDRTSL
jgi:septal ring factor EnvC (AmiA/AmiB activator)